VLKVENLNGRFPHQVGLHQSCHGLRELRLGPSSEVMKPRDSMMESLIDGLDGIRFSKLSRRDECCGFGGTFAVAEEAVSCMMGDDRVNDHINAGTEVLTAGDMSCLMHLEGIIRRVKCRCESCILRRSWRKRSVRSNLIDQPANNIAPPTGFYFRR
jgi:L-lactate dehydrogenase complex protein LldE